MLSADEFSSGPDCVTLGIFLLLWSLLAYCIYSSLLSSLWCLLLTYRKLSSITICVRYRIAVTNIKYTNIVLRHAMQNGCHVPSEPAESFITCLKWKFFAAFCYFFLHWIHWDLSHSVAQPTIVQTHRQLEFLHVM